MFELYDYKNTTQMNSLDNSTSARALNEIEAAHYICMSRSYLAQSRMDGQRANRTPAPPFIKIGKSVRYLKDDLDRWLDSFQKLEYLEA